MGEQEFLTQVKLCHGLILKLIGLYAYSLSDRNDLYQEILLNAWKGLGRFRKEAKFSTWLYQVAINTIFTANRKANAISYSDCMEDFIIPVLPQSEQKEDVQRLYAAIRRLAEVDRVVITMHLEGYGNPEIAEVLGINANYIGVKLHRVKNQLQTILRKE
ncbi:RNA polymerase sigma factor [Mucilaginibacter psychrotolerans]|uniref:RNA polymerase sigma factor n=1 Tax=Mucilaginibacter psychrotolerans TaxID=1524096 RepID=A0A4Y8SQ80_9SPHI|nr:RNA polymerase sigma factor [Mucilaginibacter psychrotolerans]TFF40791.1 RNA polymerase sigma factor [Mucilaginibacter psychrotolerans]